MSVATRAHPVAVLTTGSLRMGAQRVGKAIPCLEIERLLRGLFRAFN